MAKIAVISAHFPPKIVGGAEYSAAELARGLSGRGHEIEVLSTAPDEEMVGEFEDEQGKFPVHRVWMPRPYPAYYFAGQAAFNKAVWHTQDVTDARNVEIWDRFLRKTNPNIALVHVPQGLGFNGFEALGRFNIPVIYILHDLSLACIRTSMFKGGVDCESLCFTCNISSSLKQSALRKIDKLHLVSPSKANLDHVLKFVDVPYLTKRVILNANTYPRVDNIREPGARELLYVGQVSELKGVDFLIRVLASMALPDNTRLTVVGGGVELEELKARYSHLPWLNFTGHVSQSEVAEQMARANLLCVPSLWRENSPGVVIQALGQGLPVFASRTGGVPELVDDGVTGRLLAPGNHEVWRAALGGVLADSSDLNYFADQIASNPGRFDSKLSLDAYESLIIEALA